MSATVIHAPPPVPDSILRRPAARCTLNGPELDELREGLRLTVAQFEAVGCAAPQIGRSEQVAVIVARGLELTIVNPRLYAVGRGREQGIEGCLSLAGRHFSVRRYRSVRLETVDDWGERLSLTVRGWLARIIQHEVDHLRGVLVDRSGVEVD